MPGNEIIMKKPWSVTTTLRNPDRLKNFLVVLKEIENLDWDFENQKKYQILLIQNRVYGFGRQQFYNGLAQDVIDLVDDLTKHISFEIAEEIFYAKNYKDPAMRGRQSINPLKKLGLVVIEDGRVKITNLGHLFLKEDFDLEEIFFRSFLKWQIPNPGSRDYPTNGLYDIKPFVGTLHLINAVNKKEHARGNETKGISKEEFSLFVPTLVHYQDINTHAEKIITLRSELSGKAKREQIRIMSNRKKQFASDFLETNNQDEINKLLKNLKDYGDNAIRYFRFTKCIYIRGGGFYIDLEPRRSIEIDSLIAYDNAQSISFGSREEYFAYISNISEPRLPWESTEKYIAIIEMLVKGIQEYEFDLQQENIKIKDLQKMSDHALQNYIKELRGYRKELQDIKMYRESQKITKIESYIKNLKDIFSFDDRPILLEKLSTLGLQALNDAVKIQGNYLVGDDNEPISTAPGNTPDIECFYKGFNAICEVTMLHSRTQWYHEGQPVMRHLRDFEQKHSDKSCYCLFIAPTLHRDTINTFWTAIKYEYEGRRQKIIPLSINQFVSILNVLLKMRAADNFLSHMEIARLYDEILDSSTVFSNSNDWIKNIPRVISAWKVSLISQA